MMILWWGGLVHPVALPAAAAAAAMLVAVNGCSPSNAEICRLGAWQMHVFSRVLAALRLRHLRQTYIRTYICLFRHSFSSCLHRWHFATAAPVWPQCSVSVWLV